MEKTASLKGLSVSDDFARVRSTGYSVELGDTISKAWSDYVKPNLGPLIGYFVVMIIILFAVNIVFAFVELIPYVGIVISAIAKVVIQSILGAGIMVFFIKIYQFGNAEFSDFFESFKMAMPLALSAIVQALIIYAPILLIGGAMYAVGSDVIQDFVYVLENAQNNPEAMIGMLSGVFGIIAIFSVIAIVVSSFYIFTPIIILTGTTNFWEAMESSRKLVMANYLGVLGFLFVVGLVVSLGALACGIGVLVTLPIAPASIFVLYTKLVEQNGGGSHSNTGFYADENAPLDVF